MHSAKEIETPRWSSGFSRLKPGLQQRKDATDQTQETAKLVLGKDCPQVAGQLNGPVLRKWPATLRLDEAHTEREASALPIAHSCKVAIFLVAAPVRIWTYGVNQVCKLGGFFCKLANLANLTADDPVPWSM